MGVAFWLGGKLFQDQALSHIRYIHPAKSNELESDFEIPIDSILIRAEIEPSQKRTSVEITRFNSLESPLELEFPTTQTAQLEKQIAETLNIPLEEVKDKIRYRVVNSQPPPAPPSP
ncbi:MAG TPA: hypothetical protein V6C88_01235 [Chroococcidiopsis sp.]